MKTKWSEETSAAYEPHGRGTSGGLCIFNVTFSIKYLIPNVNVRHILYYHHHHEHGINAWIPSRTSRAMFFLACTHQIRRHVYNFIQIQTCWHVGTIKPQEVAGSRLSKRQPVKQQLHSYHTCAARCHVTYQKCQALDRAIWAAMWPSLLRRGKAMCQSAH